LNNAIDNESFEHDLEALTNTELRSAYEAIDADGSASIGLFCGSLYPDKKLDFLVAAADRIQKRIPGFRLVIVGDGPCRKDVEYHAASRPWLHCVGVRKGKEKAAYFRMADVVLNPGLVGLHVLDSFCAGVPMITTAEARHSPEIAYLCNDVNGLIVGGAVEAYAEAVIALLEDHSRLTGLKQRALIDGKKFTLEKMVTHFADGIERCLASPQKR
jgi:glycosyltransferase involved in cell wall biosynthesis